MGIDFRCSPVASPESSSTATGTLIIFIVIRMSGKFYVLSHVRNQLTGTLVYHSDVRTAQSTVYDLWGARQDQSPGDFGDL